MTRCITGQEPLALRCAGHAPSHRLISSRRGKQRQHRCIVSNVTQFNLAVQLCNWRSQGLQASGSGQRSCGASPLQMSGTARLDTRQSRAIRLCNRLVDRSWTVTYPCTVPLCNGLAGYTWGWSLCYPNVQWAGRLCIGVEFRLSGCTTGLLILAGYTSGQLSGCATHIYEQKCLLQHVLSSSVIVTQL